MTTETATTDPAAELARLRSAWSNGGKAGTGAAKRRTPAQCRAAGIAGALARWGALKKKRRKISRKARALNAAKRK